MNLESCCPEIHAPFKRFIHLPSIPCDILRRFRDVRRRNGLGPDTFVQKRKTSSAYHSRLLSPLASWNLVTSGKTQIVR